MPPTVQPSRQTAAVANVVVVGSGIIGLAVGARLVAQGDTVTIIDKESGPAKHQTGRNSGVIHSGLYYAPGSQRAAMCLAGSASMHDFARERGVAVQICGKLVVAPTEAQRPGLERLAERARANRVSARLITAAEAKEFEPHVRCVAALRVDATGIVDYPGVCRALADDVVAGGDIRYETAFVSARTDARGVVVETTAGELRADQLVACAGLHSDRVAAASGLTPEARIVPFRGEYYELAANRRELVNGLIYPVPDPRFPFLGVHLTKMVNGDVHAGPNAVLALAREGYRWRDINVGDVRDALSWPGLWRMGSKNLVPGAREVARSLSKRLFARSLAELVPAITAADLVRSAAGVRAQAMRRDGTLVDDFLIQSAPRQVHVLNAPSPAATCALEIARHIVDQLDTAAAG
jgi:(S)-2-hydroxyglutarate dehydrogenase